MKVISTWKNKYNLNYKKVLPKRKSVEKNLFTINNIIYLY